jgi:hypothetical protein
LQATIIVFRLRVVVGDEIFLEDGRTCVVERATQSWSVVYLPVSGSALQSIADRGDGVPIAGGGRDAEMLLDDGVGIEDAVGLAAPEAEAEATGDGDEFELPLVATRFFERQGGSVWGTLVITVT